jgi:hypothetical protein
MAGGDCLLPLFADIELFAGANKTEMSAYTKRTKMSTGGNTRRCRR